VIFTWFLQESARPGWYDWPWGAVGAIAILVGLVVWLLRMVLTDYFAKPSQLTELRATLVSERTELKEALEERIDALAEELGLYEGRCDARTTKFEEKLEKGFATIVMLNGVGDRIAAVDKRVDATATLFTQTRERADQAHELARDLRKDFQHFTGRIEEKLAPVADLKKDLQHIDEKFDDLSRILARIASAPPHTSR
jgi:chromosome segregation ATPase